MIEEYGVFAQLVGVCTSLVAAATAITLAFKQRSKWQPPAEAVPNAVARMTALISSVFVATLYVFSSQIGIVPLLLISVLLLCISVGALLSAIKINITHSYYYPDDNKEDHRVLGGNVLTDEAQKIQSEHKHNDQQMLSDAQGKKDLVWTRGSIAKVNLNSTITFIILIAAGSCALSAAGSMVALYIHLQA